MKENILNHLRICTEMEQMGINWEIKAGHPDEELLDFLGETKKTGLNEHVSRLGKRMIERLICDVSFCQMLEWLLEEGISPSRITIFSVCAGDTRLSACDYGRMSKVLKDEEIPNEDTWNYYRWYLDKPYSKEQKESLLLGLCYYRCYFKADLSELTPEERDILLEPCFCEDLYEYIRDTGSLLAYHKDPEFLNCMNYLDGLLEQRYCVTDEQVKQIAKAPKEIKRRLEEVVSMVSKEDHGQLLLLWLDNENLLYDLIRMCRVFAQNETEKAESCDGEPKGTALIRQAAEGRVSYLALIYGADIGKLADNPMSSGREALLVYAVANKKRHFLNLVRENKELFESLPSSSVLFRECFYRRYVNINTLNAKNLAQCALLTRLPDESLMIQETYTFEEIRCLCGQSGVCIRLYHKLALKRVDDRLKVIREVIKRHCLPKLLSDEELETLSGCLSAKALSGYMQDEFGQIRSLRFDMAIRLLAHMDEIGRFLPELHTAQQAEYLLRNRERLSAYEKFSDFEAALLKEDEAWLQMKETFHMDDDFISRYRDGILTFLQEGGAEIVMDFCGQEPEKIEKTRRLVTADVMGKFDEIKYHANDLEKEIDFPVSALQESLWKQNRKCTSKDGITVWEEDGFLPVMQIGEIPTQTCLSYKRGSHKNCLLSCFDANKKVIFASKNGTIVFRAIMRLTKGNYHLPTTKVNQSVEFVDLTGPVNETKKPEMELSGSRLTLFLERPYQAFLSNEELGDIMEMVVSLAEEKAEKMQAEFVLNSDYWICRMHGNQYIRSHYALFISQSKNGEQYLDSLGGAATVYDAMGYRNGIFFVKASGNSVR